MSVIFLRYNHEKRLVVLGREQNKIIWEWRCSLLCAYHSLIVVIPEQTNYLDTNFSYFWICLYLFWNTGTIKTKLWRAGMYEHLGRNPGINGWQIFQVPTWTCYYKLVGFGRACAPVNCAHPSFWALCHAQQGAARPPPISFAAPPKIKIKLFPEKKCLPSGPNSGRQEHIFFHCMG